jgi:hypothetical protein
MLQVLAVSEKDDISDSLEGQNFVEKLFSEEEIFEVGKPSEEQGPIL